MFEIKSGTVGFRYLFYRYTPRKLNVDPVWGHKRLPYPPPKRACIRTTLRATKTRGRSNMTSAHLAVQNYL